MKRHKAQVQSQVFIFILAAVIIALTAIFGFKIIKGMIENPETLETAQMLSDLSQKIDRLEYDSTDIISLELPINSEMCFINASIPDPCNGRTANIADSALIKEAQAGDNTISIYYLDIGIRKVKTEKQVFPFKDDHPLSCLCVSSKDARRRILIEGIGRYVAVKLA